MTAAAPGPFAIGGEAVAPGTGRNIELPVSTTATGIPSTIAVRVLHGTRPGPCIFVSGAVHGDEIVGTAIVQRLAQELAPADIAGTVLLIPVANIFGFLNRNRYLPDRRDLNRSFPGNAQGSLAGQLAHAFFNEIIVHCTVGIDIHSAAVHRYNLPQIRIAEGQPPLLELALAFGAPVIMESPLRDGSMRQIAAERGVDVMVMEAGEALRFDALSIETGVAGVKRVLAHLGMIASETGPGEGGVPARARKSSWVRAPRGGIMTRLRRSGDPVHAGDLLARVGGLFGEDAREVTSPVDGIIIGHATLPVVHQGDALFHIARITHPERAGEQIDNITDAILNGDGDEPAAPMLDEDEVD